MRALRSGAGWWARALLGVVLAGAAARAQAAPPGEGGEAGAAAAAAEVCAPDAAGFCTAKVVRHPLSYVDSAQKIRINTALGDVVSLEFPAGVGLRGDPALGNTAIFEFRASRDPFRILVWPKMPTGARDVTPEDLEGATSNLQVFLDSGVTVIVDLVIAPRAQAVQRVVFDFPQRERESEFVQAQLADQARRLREDFEAEKKALEVTVAERTQRAMARAMLERHHCAALRARGERDLLIVWARQICRIGDYTFIRFTVRNRYRDVFHLQRVEVREAGGGEGDGTLEALVEWTAEPLLAFGQEAEGIAIFGVGEGAKQYVLTVVESGGKKRVVEVDDVEF